MSHDPNWKVCKRQADEHLEKAGTYIEADRSEIAGAHTQAAAIFLVGMMLCQQLDQIRDAINESGKDAGGRWRGAGP